MLPTWKNAGLEISATQKILLSLITYLCNSPYAKQQDNCIDLTNAELAAKIERYEKHILNTFETKLSNARVESINNKFKLFIRKAYGFRNIQNMFDMIMLGCSNIRIPLPNRGDIGVKAA